MDDACKKTNEGKAAAAASPGVAAIEAPAGPNSAWASPMVVRRASVAIEPKEGWQAATSATQETQTCLAHFQATDSNHTVNGNGEISKNVF